MDWLPEAMRILRDELPNIEVTVCSQYSPESRGSSYDRKARRKHFLRPEANTPDLVFKLAAREPLVVVLPSDHPLASRDAIVPQDLVGETFINVSGTAPTLRVVIDAYLKQSGIDITPAHEVDNLAMAMSLVASTRGVALLPAYATEFSALVCREPTDQRRYRRPSTWLIGHHRANSSPVLALFLSRVDDMIARGVKDLKGAATVTERDAPPTQLVRSGGCWRGRCPARRR